MSGELTIRITAFHGVSLAGEHTTYQYVVMRGWLVLVRGRKSFATEAEANKAGERAAREYQKRSN